MRIKIKTKRKEEKPLKNDYEKINETPFLPLRPKKKEDADTYLK